MLLHIMSRFIKVGIIFCAEYLVIAQVFIFLLFATQALTLPLRMGIILTGVTLLLCALLLTKILKIIIHKRRPPKKIEYFTPFDRYAFPSAHATALFSIATFIISQNILIGVISFFVSFCVVIARIKSHVHDFSDILGGFVVGVSVTYYLMPYVTTWVYSFLVPMFV